ncbi:MULTISPECIES: class I SAM-dependent methyltransferase [Bradyrhizobium]|uniref:class I SAM-dependent methyltransferase n=1 Tax=Bradyrhizobium TaxID=374 RepID=UPI001449E69D|nr:MULTISPECIES: class I SAM-dependent methyltransferase [Bradyrhizobium]MCP1930332.1 SAM-dependent methyltransferase [Bradyrhizobium elkanii]MCS3481409.1 SAM-dependent methyltransferase [Bradyrhizobium elkanii]MCS3518254.1 SAM-dependent methyltransferase [Bradyrhizobium elkanii]MCS3579051.1 SAM-dependent methyltransferase [Bradyrhizobium elkanii]MCS3690337.1 SAM-dependent methyltransferase [Bradyrhizobium elkanii]
MLGAIQARFSNAARQRRGEFLVRTVILPLDAKILDLGGGTGRHIRAILPRHTDITVCDISADDLKAARERFGFKTVLLQETERLPFDDQAFDFCFCSSVIEHVTGPKQDVVAIESDATFLNIAREHQNRFAGEISRVAKSFYVQTPYRYFPIESHTWLPGIIVLLPRRPQIALINIFNRFWFKRTAPDWHLFDWREMTETFPDAKIYRERYLGMTKSLMAIKA